VRGLLENGEFRPREHPVVERGRRGRRLVEAAAGEERGKPEFPEPLRPLEPFQRAPDREFARPPHMLVYPAAHPLEGPVQAFRPWLHPAEVAPIEGHHRIQIPRGGKILRVLALRDVRLCLFGKEGQVPPLVRRPPRRAQAGAGQDQAGHAFRSPRKKVVDRQHRPPRLAEEADAQEAERPAHRRELLHETLERPQRPVLRPVRIAAPELVVQDDGSSVGQRLQRFEVVMRGAGASVEREQRDPRRFGVHDPVPDLPARNWDRALPDRPVPVHRIPHSPSSPRARRDPYIVGHPAGGGKRDSGGGQGSQKLAAEISC